MIKFTFSATVEDWEAVFEVNVRGVFLCVREAAEQMVKQGTEGKIIGELLLVLYDYATVVPNV
jgi:meso-butanediol dehydrogenase / (S,S)-butanediol dehydrogenase / diacetyl reductase